MPLSWKTPYRPKSEITQSYNDGMVEICAVSDGARPGYQPVEQLRFKARLRYEERTLGIQRAYLAKQAQTEVERVLRTPRVKGVGPRDVAVTEDGRQYRVDLVQSVNGVYPPSVDLTLARLEQEGDL